VCFLLCLLLHQGEVDAVLLSGDLSYANGYLANWDFFLDSLAPIAGNFTFVWLTSW
jgi:hypothetical protein